MTGEPKKQWGALFKRAPLFWIVVFLTLTYGLLAFGFFALKNDAFIFNFPPKHFFSRVLQAGYLPVWNPYLNYGFPLYADPGFAWWQPVTWVFGSIGYTPYLLSLEVLVYLFIAAAGTYKLCSWLGVGRVSAICAACTFAGSGFFVGNMQHINFITVAAFVPWLVFTWLRLQHQPSLKYAFFCALTVYCVVTGGHPAMPIATLYFMATIAIGYVLLFRDQISWKGLARSNGLLLISALMLLTPLFYSWATILPVYERSLPIQQSGATTTGFTLPSYLSFISPLFTIRGEGFFGTDISMRNGYFSVVAFVFFISFLFTPWDRWTKLFLLSAVVMLLLSAGGTTKSVLFSRLPLLTHIRTNGAFRVLALLPFVVVTSRALQSLQSEPQILEIFFRLRKLLIALLGASIAVALFLIAEPRSTQPSLLTLLHTAGPKAALDAVTAVHFIALGGTISLVVLLVSRGVYKRFGVQGIAVLILLDVMLNAWIMQPITAYGQKSPKDLAAILGKTPKGFQISNSGPPLTFSSAESLAVGAPEWYSQNIIQSSVDYPSRFNQEIKSDLISKAKDSGRPYFLLRTGNQINLVRFVPHEFSFAVSVQNLDTAVLLQNWYPDWVVIKNGKREKPVNYKGALSVAVTPQDSQIIFTLVPFSQ